MTNEQQNKLEDDRADIFNETLAEILLEYNGNQLLSIPGVYEILSEKFNNEVLEKMEKDKKILKITRQDIIEKLSNSLINNITEDVYRGDFAWFNEVVTEGFIGYNTMNNEDLAQEYWEYFSPLDNEGYDNIEIC